eukprot:m.134646 g.134646  ORF g.134646 m.134646 type:complete len:952 (-) comp9661_c0_seq1:123-2978(-)
MSDGQEWNAASVRTAFIDFFKDKNQHTFVPSSSTIPHDDPTLLFANAGMNQFKPIFLGTVDENTDMATWKAAVNSQKCIRAGGKHNDLDDVGKDVYHHTFFEMLGNWSFGDYGKPEAIDMAMDLLLNVFKLDSNRLYVTYYSPDTEGEGDEDLEAKEHWKKYLPDNRILPFGKKDNFWEMGETGPCGPCSEIHYDRIGGREVPELVNMDDPDLLEIWNLVFMQYNRQADGKLVKLPAQHVDTGMGLERLLSVLMNKSSNYDTDLFTPIFDNIHNVCGIRAYRGRVGKADDDGIDMAYRVVADHIRTLTMAISDGGMPDKDGRGYILRLVLRRAIRYCEEYLNAPQYYFSSLVPVVVDILGDAFPELRHDPNSVIAVLKDEEQQFRRTLNRGRRYFQRAVKALDGNILSGDAAWMLWDSYGFPIHLTIVMAEERNLTVDMVGFEAAKQRAIEISQAGGKKRVDGIDLDVNLIDTLKKTNVASTDDSFKYNYSRGEDGKYVFEDADAKIVAVVTLDGLTDSVSASEDTDEVVVGIVLDKTNFYAEQGGQEFDTGSITINGGVELDVLDVQKRGPYCLHIAALSSGAVNVGDSVHLSIDNSRRRPLMSNHTATHVLNFALRKVLGEADQKGSLVESERLRFDFTAKKQMTIDQIIETEALVREQVDAGLTVYDKLTPLAQAREINGLRAMFGETYPDPVRVISVGKNVDEMLADPASDHAVTASVEFCGGTHVKNSGDIGEFTIISEEAVAKGIRRIVAVTGDEAKKAARRGVDVTSRVTDDLTMNDIANMEQEIGSASIPASTRDILRKKLKSLSMKHAEAKKAMRKAKAANAKSRAKELIDEKAGPFILEILDVGANAKAIGDALKLLEKALPEIPMLFFGVEEDSVQYVARVPKSAVEKGVDAAEWCDIVTKIVNGRGGGRELKAQGSSQESSKVTEAIEAAKKYIEEKLA